MKERKKDDQLSAVYANYLCEIMIIATALIITVFSMKMDCVCIVITCILFWQPYIHWSEIIMLGYPYHVINLSSTIPASLPHFVFRE